MKYEKILRETLQNAKESVINSLPPAYAHKMERGGNLGFWWIICLTFIRIIWMVIFENKTLQWVVSSFDGANFWTCQFLTHDRLQTCFACVHTSLCIVRNIHCWLVAGSSHFWARVVGILSLQRWLRFFSVLLFFLLSLSIWMLFRRN